MSKVEISVIMPVYNSEEYISTAIESVLNQTFSDYELIIVNDGSKDRSGEICEEYARRDNRIRYFNKVNGGVCSARNFGLEKAEGRYIYFIDNDDEMDCNLFADNIALLKKYNADIVKFERVRKEYKDNVLIKEVPSIGVGKIISETNRSFLDKEAMKKSFYDIYRKNILMYIWTGIYNKELFDQYNLKYNENFKNGHEDILMNMQLYRYANSIVFNDKAYYYHNWRLGTSASSVFTMDRIKDAMVVTDYEKKLMIEFGYDSDLILSVYMDNLFICLAMMNNSINKCSIKKQKLILDLLYKKVKKELGDYRDDINNLLKKHMYKHYVFSFLFYKKFYFLLISIFKFYTKIF